MARKQGCKDYPLAIILEIIRGEHKCVYSID